MESNTNQTVDIKAINEKIEKESAFVDLLTLEMKKVIVGQKQMVDRLLIGLLGQGHILLEGVPGLAKTLAINTLSQAVKGSFSRIQFTPDLLPADVVGTMIYNIKQNDFSIKKGPVFANFVLADEINRAPAKVQSALLEAMQEKQVTIGDTTFKLQAPFLVMATQNPVEQEGTYPLPEAQVDRFMLKTVIDYPKLDEEQLIVRNNLNSNITNIKPVVTTKQIISCLNEGQSTSVRDTMGRTPLHLASLYSKDPKVIKLLIQGGSKIDARNASGGTALHDAASRNRNPSVLETLIRAGADVNAKNSNKWSKITHNPLNWMHINIL